MIQPGRIIYSIIETDFRRVSRRTKIPHTIFFFFLFIAITNFNSGTSNGIVSLLFHFLDLCILLELLEEETTETCLKIIILYYIILFLENFLNL